MESKKMEDVVVAMKEKPVDNRVDGISDKNEVIASGVIVNRRDFDKVTYLTLMVRGGKKLDKKNYPCFTLLAKDKEKAEGLTTGDHVKIKAQIRTRKNPKENGFQESWVVTDIERTKSRLAELTLENELGRVRDIPVAEFLVIGTVVKSEIYGKGVVHLVVKSQTDEQHTTYGNFYAFPKDLSQVINDIQVGKRVCMIGEIQTEKKEKENEKTQYLQSNVVNEISSVENILSIKR